MTTRNKGDNRPCPFEPLLQAYKEEVLSREAVAIGRWKRSREHKEVKIDADEARFHQIMRSTCHIDEHA